MKSLARIDIPAVAMTLEGSFGGQRVGSHASTMELFEGQEGHKMIEWDIPGIERTEHIGLKFDGKTLVDYDGVMTFPKEAAAFLRGLGYVVGKEFA